jgi:WD40 repeat protein
MCANEGQFWNITDPANPDTTHPVEFDDAGVNYWHSAEFTWDGLYVVTNDESFTGVCAPNGDGKIRIWRVADAHLMSTFQIPRQQTTYCSVHNGNIIPIAGRYLLVAAWYGGGTSVIDFTNPSQPREIGYYRATTGRGASDAWSSYWYNGKIYVNDITRGVDVLDLAIPGNGYGAQWGHLNAQTQEDLYPPPFSPVARLAMGAAAP